jgi:hypothetical protein
MKNFVSKICSKSQCGKIGVEFASFRKNSKKKLVCLDNDFFISQQGWGVNFSDQKRFVEKKNQKNLDSQIFGYSVQPEQLFFDQNLLETCDLITWDLSDLR